MSFDCVALFIGLFRADFAHRTLQLAAEIPPRRACKLSPSQVLAPCHYSEALFFEPLLQTTRHCPSSPKKVVLTSLSLFVELWVFME